MTIKLCLLLLFLSACSLAQPPTEATPFGVRGDDKLTATVHPGVELLSIIQYLAGRAGPTPSPYLTDVRRHFAPFRNHPAVLFLFQSDKRFGYDLPELGWCFNNPLHPTAFSIPDSTYWLKAFTRAELTTYLTQCMAFARQSGFAAFYQRHQRDYDLWGQTFRQRVDSLQIVGKLEAFYGKPTTSRWYICLDPLNSYGAHAIMTKTLAPRYGNYIVYQQGYWNRQASATKTPTFQSDLYNLVWHEGSHIYTHHLISQHKTVIDSMSQLMKKSDMLTRQNVTDWPYFVDESLVRAISVALHRKYLTPQEAQQCLDREIKSGFVYTDELARFILTDYLNTHQFSDFDSYFPVLLRQWATLRP